MNANHNTKFIAFSSQKGGVGKSTFTTLVASTLHYRLGHNVAVFDADFPQHSLIKMKSRDLAMVMENEHLKKLAYKQFTTINKKAYPILQHKAESVLEAAEEFLNTSDVPIDVLFFDLPGTVNTPGILKALAGMHHIFTPITADRLVMESTLIFTQLLQDVIMKKGATSIETIISSCLPVLAKSRICRAFAMRSQLRKSDAACSSPILDFSSSSSVYS
ncbi:ParA family protein [Flavobacterium xanthum]|uniref:ParA family protein n=1 Tax=Flavobacterium xanthum TaxID=69322 RepID=UPI000A04A2D6|nr:ParA family protein [Flavobacterium xanthum]